MKKGGSVETDPAPSGTGVPSILDHPVRKVNGFLTVRGVPVSNPEVWRDSLPSVEGFPVLSGGCWSRLTRT